MAHGDSHPREGHSRLRSWLLHRRQAEQSRDEGPSCSEQYEARRDKSTLAHSSLLSFGTTPSQNCEESASRERDDKFDGRASSLDRTDREHAAQLFADAVDSGNGSRTPSPLPSPATSGNLRRRILTRSSSGGEGRLHRPSWLKKLLVRRSRSEGAQVLKQPLKGSDVPLDSNSAEQGSGPGVLEEGEEWLVAFLDELKEKKAEAQVEADEVSKKWQREDDWRDNLVERARELGIKLPLTAICEEPEEELAALRDSLRWSTAF